ncbi:MAG: sigma-70 family RNA polymerase sigma factor [bacterium]
MKLSGNASRLRAQRNIELSVQAQAGSKEALDLLFIENKGLFCNIARRLLQIDSRAASLSLEDLIHESWPAFCKGVMRYDPNREPRVNFSTYICFWIRSGMQDAFARWSGVAHVPEYLLEIKKKVSRGDDPEKIRMSPFIAKQIERDLTHSVSLDELSPEALNGMQSDESRSGSESTEDAVFRAECGRVLMSAMSRLTKRERKVLELRYFEDMKLVETNDALLKLGLIKRKLSRERIRQYQLMALDKLKMMLIVAGFDG